MRRLLLKLILLAVSISFVLAVGEIFIAITMPQDMGIWRTERDGLITLHPNISTYLPSYGHDVRTNSFGFRDEPVSRVKPEDVFRVIIVGDSFMEALQVAHEQSLPHLVEDRLTEDSGRRIEVLNAGVSGWGTDDQLDWLRRDGFDLDPDLVVVAMTLHNDVSDNLEMNRHKFVDGVVSPRSDVQLSWPRYVELKIKGWLATHSQLYRFTTRAMRGGEIRKRAGRLDHHVDRLFKLETTERTALGWKLTRAHLDAIQTEGASIGADTAIFLIPLAVQISDQAFSEFLSLRGLKPDQVDRMQPQRQILDWGRDAGVEVIDLLPVLRRYTGMHSGLLYVPRDGHWNEMGHKLAAGAVSDALIGLDLVPRGIHRNK